MNRLFNYACLFHSAASRVLFRRKYTTLQQNNAYKLLSISALSDNYMYVIINTKSQLAIAIDPVEPEKLLVALKKENVKLHSVLTTHHHYDHCGGNIALLEKIPGTPIYGGDERIDGLTQKVVDNKELELNSFSIKCLFTPCHTSGHMCYFLTAKEGPPVCFTGDTLFVAGCGRFFEGTAENMLTSLLKLSCLPTNTLVCCGHEYTVSNLNFAVHVEPSNAAAKKKLSWAMEMRHENQPTVPSSIGNELCYNPFMRLNEAEVQKFTGQTNPVKVMDELRKHKDTFKMS